MENSLKRLAEGLRVVARLQVPVGHPEWRRYFEAVGVAFSDRTMWADVEEILSQDVPGIHVPRSTSDLSIRELDRSLKVQQRLVREANKRFPEFVGVELEPGRQELVEQYQAAEQIPEHTEDIYTEFCSAMRPALKRLRPEVLERSETICDHELASARDEVRQDRWATFITSGWTDEQLEAHVQLAESPQVQAYAKVLRQAFLEAIRRAAYRLEGLLAAR